MENVETLTVYAKKVSKEATALLNHALIAAQVKEYAIEQCHSIQDVFAQSVTQEKTAQNQHVPTIAVTMEDALKEYAFAMKALMELIAVRNYV